MATRIRDLKDVDFDPLNASKNKQLIKYNHTKQKFDLINADDVLSNVETISESFVEVAESEINLSNVRFSGVDGGVF